MVVMLAAVGLSIDLGRMFVYKNELQTFADASALAAVSQLDGTQTGVVGAETTATNGPLGTTRPNGYNFDTVAVSNVSTGYATTFTGTYDNYATANSGGGNSYRFLKVTASANVPLTFLPVLPGIATQMAVSASATAGQQGSSTVSNPGPLPFAPDAHDQADLHNFGLTPGVQYTLKWGNGNTTTCAGDLGFTPPGSPPSEHGFVDIGEGNSNSNVRKAIEYGGYPNADSNPSSLSTGDDLSGVPGNRGSSIFDALRNRSAQDTDDLSTTYAQYKATGTGNRRRIVTVPIVGTWGGHGSNAAAPILGFANFFLNVTYAGTSGPICAEYIGTGNLSGYGSGASDGTKVYSNMLYK
jgi:Flp pilus assembly protein TadG